MNNRKNKIIMVLFFLIVIITLIGCSKEKPTPTPSTPNPITTQPIQGQSIDDGRGETAFDAYLVAEVEAKNWDEEALLFQIPVTQIMESNLGIPPGIPGWFFMFKVPDSPLEYYVKVVNGKVAGTTEAQPILIEDLPYQYLPIDINKLSLNSDDVLRLFTENGGREYVNSHPELQLDYRLVHINGQEHPIWSLFEVSNLNQPTALFHVDAITGEIVADPFSNY